jgi:hypothetical protein
MDLIMANKALDLRPQEFCCVLALYRNPIAMDTEKNRNIWENEYSLESQSIHWSVQNSGRYYWNTANSLSGLLNYTS